MKNNTFFYHTPFNEDKTNRVTVCGVFVEETRRFVVAAVAKPMNGFSKRSGRIGSLGRTSARPFISSPCTTLEQAGELFMPLAILISTAMENDPACCLKFPRSLGRGKNKSVIDVSSIAEHSAAPEPPYEEKGAPKVINSLLNQKLKSVG